MVDSYFLRLSRMCYHLFAYLVYDPAERLITTFSLPRFGAQSSPTLRIRFARKRGGGKTGGLSRFTTLSWFCMLRSTRVNGVFYLHGTRDRIQGHTLEVSDGTCSCGVFFLPGPRL